MNTVLPFETEYSFLVKQHAAAYKKSVLHIGQNGFCENRRTGHHVEHPYILPLDKAEMNLLPGVSMPSELSGDSDKLNSYYNFLNSSQMMCVNFFQLMTSDRIRQMILIRELELAVPRLKYVNRKLGRSTIKTHLFEYVPVPQENTHFDYFIELENGVHIYFEIKYSESCFGGPTKLSSEPEKYEKKWNDFYAPALKDWNYIPENRKSRRVLTKEDIFAHYQLWRNISFLKTGTDFFICLYPEKNTCIGTEFTDTLKRSSFCRRKSSEQFALSKSNIRGITWDDFTENCWIRALIKSSANELHSPFVCADFRLLADSLLQFQEKYLELENHDSTVCIK